MVFNFAVNNVLTYRDHRLRGAAWFTGLLTFIAACSVGAVANVGIARYLFANHAQWLLAALAGIMVSAVWNYSVTQLYTWSKKLMRRTASRRRPGRIGMCAVVAWWLPACCTLLADRLELRYGRGVLDRARHRPFSEMIAGAMRDTPHPPLHIVLLHFWSYLFGGSEVAARSLSVCCRWPSCWSAGGCCAGCSATGARWARLHCWH